MALLQECIGGPITSTLVFANSTFKAELCSKKMADADIYIVQLEGTSEVSIEKPTGYKEKVPSTSTLTFHYKIPQPESVLAAVTTGLDPSHMSQPD